MACNAQAAQAIAQACRMQVMYLHGTVPCTADYKLVAQGEPASEQVIWNKQAGKYMHYALKATTAAPEPRNLKLKPLTKALNPSTRCSPSVALPVLQPGSVYVQERHQVPLGSSELGFGLL